QRLGELERIRLAWKSVEDEYEKLKTISREVARGRDIKFPADGVLVLVEQLPDAVCRSVADEDLPHVIELEGDHVFDLNTLHPSRREHANFELHARKLLTKARAEKLLARLYKACKARV